jgi:two-component system cell cycle sensor histidine kinase/response regulator CckA
MAFESPKSESAAISSEPARLRLSLIERREWWLWAAAVIVTLLLTAGILSFLPSITSSDDGSDSTFLLPRAMWGLLAVVLLFDVYAFYQQLQIHRMRKRLFEREALFRLISENAADMIAVVDAEGRRIFNSLSYQKVLGYSPAELQSSPPFEQIHPEDRKRVEEAAAEARRSGDGRTLEYRMRHKDGSWRVLESTASVIRDPLGRARELIIVNRDVTERKKAAESLRLSESEFRSMIQDAPYGICRCDSRGRLLKANPAFKKMLGFDGPNGTDSLDAVADVFNTSQEFQELRDLFSEGKEFRDLEIVSKRADGLQITVRCSGRRAKDPEGQTCFDVFAEDVSERRVLERQLQMAAKMEAIGRLSGGVAHDFNNLLGVIIGYSQLIKRKLESGSHLSEYAEEIDKAGQRAAALTRQLLAFSRQQILSPAVLDLNDLVSDMLKMLPRLLGEDIAVETKFAPDLGRTKADRGQIEQVIMNLAVNARDAMPTGGTLRITTKNRVLDQTYTRQHPGSRAGSYVLLSVADSGTGIDAETLTHIFEPFFTTKEVGKGTGLGLATVYGVVKQSDGYIAVDSEPGNGASFEIYLPRVDEPADVPVTSSSDPHISQGSETVLVVEDAEPLRRLTQSILESYGHRVMAAHNAEEAIQIAQRYPGKIDLLLTDVVMPGMNGKALADQLSRAMPALKVLFMSGYTDSFIAVHKVLAEDMALLHKPFTEDVLIRKVRQVLDGNKVHLAR